jgi:predicted dehydrogenase
MGPQYDNIRLSNPLAGGALMDVGCYCVSFSRLVARGEPAELHASARIGERSRVDEVTSGCMKFPSGAVAHFDCATQCASPIEARVLGSEGSITIANPWFPSDETAKVAVASGGSEETFDVKHGRELYANEALTVAEHLDAREAPRPAMSWEDSRGQMRALDALRESMGLRFDCE